MTVKTTTLEALRKFCDGQTTLPDCFCDREPDGKLGGLCESKRDSWHEWTIDALGAAVMGYPIPAPEDYLDAVHVNPSVLTLKAVTAHNFGPTRPEHAWRARCLPDAVQNADDAACFGYEECEWILTCTAEAEHALMLGDRITIRVNPDDQFCTLVEEK